MKSQASKLPVPGDVRLLIVDDEPLAREGLRRIAGDHHGVEIVGECSNGLEALGAIQQLRPDAMFLDIEMPELNGFDMIGRVQPEFLPYVVFVTAYDRYALDAFKVHAIDYVLKPADRQRMREVLDRLIEEVRKQRIDEFSARLQAVLLQLEQRNGSGKCTHLERIAVKIGGRVMFVDTCAIDWIEACGNYVNLHVGTTKYLLKTTLDHLGSRLDGATFLRVHRSTIVNTRAIREFRPFLRGSYVILMKDNSKLFSSRRFHARIEAFLRLSG